MIYRFDRFQVDDEDFRLSSDGGTITLEPKTLRVLLYLLRNRSRLMRKRDILEDVWGEANVTESTLTRSIGLLRKALQDDSREPRFIETVPAAGYRFIAEVNVLERAADAVVAAGPATDGVPAPPTRAGGRIGRGTWHRTWAVATVFGLAALVLAVGWQVRQQRLASAPIRSLAVLPLLNLSGDPAEEYFADGMTDELITELARIQGLRVVSRTSVMGDKGAGKSLQQIARELRVDAVVEGSIVRSGSRVRITAQLIDARSDKHLWADSFEGPSSDVLTLQDSVARKIATQARFALSPATSRANRSGGVNPEAHDAYLRGRYFFDKAEFQRSADYFRQAMAIEPSQSSAYAGLADALEAGTTFGLGRPNEVIPDALAAATHAIELDPENGEAYTALGSIQTLYSWDWAEAERNLTRGIALSSSYSLAEAKYATYLDAVGRPGEAVEHMRRALDLDPLSFFMTRRLGATLYLNHDYDEAIVQLRRAGELNPHRPEAVDHWMSSAFLAKGRLNEAVEHDLAGSQGDMPELDVARLRSLYATNGWEAYWRARIEALQAHPENGCTWYQAGQIHLLLKETDRAFSNFNRAVDQRCFEIVWFQTEPLFEPVRSDARYRALLRRVNLPAR